VEVVVFPPTNLHRSLSSAWPLWNGSQIAEGTAGHVPYQLLFLVERTVYRQGGVKKVTWECLYFILRPFHQARIFGRTFLDNQTCNCLCLVQTVLWLFSISNVIKNKKGLSK
jgi:hypothetical protein